MHRRPVALVLALSLSTALVAAACQEEEDTAVGPVSSAEVVSNITLTPADNKPFGLATGNYRVEWTTSCSKVTVSLTGDTGYTKEKTSEVPSFSALFTSVPEGTYQIAQTDPSCTEWTISVTKM